MADNLTPSKIETLSALTTVRRISDLPIIDINDAENNSYINTSYLLSSTYLNSCYFNYRIQVENIIDYIRNNGNEDFNNLKNYFLQFVQSLSNSTNDTLINIDKIGDDFSYGLNINLAKIDQNYKGFSYNENDDASTYAYTNHITNGLVTGYVLENYVRDTLGRILGVPNTPAALSDAIDSVIEFVDWFKGYSKDNEDVGNLEKLINKIDAKDNAIQEAIQNQINDLDATYLPETNKYLTGIKQQDGKIISVDKGTISVPIEGVSTDSNSFIAGSTKYTLVVENKELKFIEYTAIAINSSNGGGSLERGTTATQTNLEFSVTTNKAFNTAIWYIGSNTSGSIADETIETSNNGKTSKITVAPSGNNTITRTCKVTESDGDVSKTKTITLSFDSYGVFYFGSASVITSDIFSVNNGGLSANNVTLTSIVKPTLLKNSGGAISSSITASLELGNENLYIYLLIPKSRINSNFKFWMGGDFPEDENLIYDNIKLYDNNIVYNLYRSLGQQTGSVSVKYGTQN